MSIIAQTNLPKALTGGMSILLSLARPSSCHTLLRGTLPRPSQLSQGSELTGTSWTATEITYPGSEGLAPVLDEHPITLTFSNNEISGIAGCNQFSGELTSLTPQKFRVEDTMSTDMYCEGDGIMSQERAFMNIIGQSVIQYSILSDGGEKQVLSLWQTFVNEDGVESRENLASLVPLGKSASSAEADMLVDQGVENFTLAGTTWEATEIDGDTPLDSDRPITLSFESEDRVNGFSGCNGFFGEWEELQGSTSPMISTNHLSSNRRLCGDDIMAQERAFMGALRQDQIFYSVSADLELTLYATAVETQATHSQLNIGSPLVTFTIVRKTVDIHFGDSIWSNLLEGTEWEATEIMGSEAITFDSPISLSFDSEARLSGYDGCNWINGPIEFIDNDTHLAFRVEGLRSTRRGCRFGPRQMEQARAFTGVLRQDAIIYNTSAQSSGPGNELTLYKATMDDDGQMVKGDLVARFDRVF